MNKPHKHAATIKAWADGAEIQVSYPQSGQAHITWSEWETVPDPRWHEEQRYRVKPVPHKWQKEIDAQRAGKVVQHRSVAGGEWVDGIFWLFNSAGEYRIKPETSVRKGYIHLGLVPILYNNIDRHTPNVEFTFEDGKLIDAKVLASPKGSS
jgi:hypothetical protein